MIFQVYQNFHKECPYRLIKLVNIIEMNHIDEKVLEKAIV